MPEKDYALGTHDAELHRLGFQHRMWRPMALEGWRRAGVTVGSRVLDVGAGPGYATRDLAEMVEADGEVIALERSERFVEAGEEFCASYANVKYHTVDVVAEEWPTSVRDGDFDVAWIRWLTSFVPSPEILVERLARAVRPGGRAIFHEYAQIQTTRTSPPLPRHEEFLVRLEESVRQAGGELNIAGKLMALLAQAGFVIRSTRPLVYCVSPSDHLWNWPIGFVAVNLRRLVDLGMATEEWAEQTLAEVEALDANPQARVITPLVLEMIVERPS